jgi:hypothetical protein
MNSAPVTLPCTSSTTATGACAAASPVKPTKPTTAANSLFHSGNLAVSKVAINKTAVGKLRLLFYLDKDSQGRIDDLSAPPHQRQYESAIP